MFFNTPTIYQRAQKPGLCLEAWGSSTTAREGEILMTQRRGTIIKQGAVTDIMSRLSELSEREKGPGTAVSLGEIFRAKEYMAEIKGALKKGYSFSDLAEIFTEKCGVNISARQIKYHLTRAKNRSVKGKSGKNAGERSLSRGCAPLSDTGQRRAAGCAKENPVAPDSAAIFSMKVPEFSSENRVAAETEGNVDSVTFSPDTRLKES
jgi:hypothetical protein